MRLVCLLLATLPAFAAEWNQFRGPNASGVIDAGNLPVAMSTGENLAWRTPVPPGQSSPVLSQRHVFLTAKEDGVLYTIAVDRETGKEAWKKESARAPQPEPKTRLAKAAPTPATDGDNVYALFDEFGLISYDAKGRERWRREMAPFQTPYGFGSSPIVEGKRLILVVDCDRDSYLLALDKDTGRQLWKTPRNVTHSYPAPVVYRPSRGPAQLLVSGAFQFASYSLDSGKKLWWVDGMAWQAKSQPVIGGGMIYVHSSMPAMHELGPLPPQKTLAEMLDAYDADKDGRFTQSEAPEGNLRALWFLFDLDGDGVLSQSEFDTFQARLALRQRTSQHPVAALLSERPLPAPRGWHPDVVRSNQRRDIEARPRRGSLGELLCVTRSRGWQAVLSKS
jgi:outer membrane protein assembly factor BamB